MITALFSSTTPSSLSSTGPQDWMILVCFLNAAGEQTVYLMPEYEMPDEAQAILKKVYLEVFELWGWHTDESAWPTNRHLRTFREWFGDRASLRHRRPV
jgi:hypothetical protein